MKTKWLAIGIILLFVGVTIEPALEQNTEKSQSSKGNWLYVGGSGLGNYTRIQDAIDNASNGDTVFVYDDSSPYVENIVINKTISLLGEDRDMTEIHDTNGSFHTIIIRANSVLIRSFKIRSAWEGEGVDIHSNNNTIEGNLFWSLLHCNIHINCDYGNNGNNIISNNIFDYFAESSIILDGNANGNIICNNSFNSASIYDGAITVANSDYNLIKNNSFEWTSIGILLEYHSEHNIIAENTFTYSEFYDVCLESSNNNTIYYNTFPHFTKVFDDGHNSWNKEYPYGGNYWMDYPNKDECSGVNQNEPGGDGIGDMLVNFQSGTNCDYYPLMLPYRSTTLKIIDKHFLRPSMTIKNIGTATALAIQWNITCNGRFVLSQENSSGIAPKTLLPNGEISVSTDFLLFGFGRTEIVFTVWAENTPKVSEKINGFLILFFFKVLKD